VVGSFGKVVGSDQLDGNNVTIFQGNQSKGVGDFTYSANPITTLEPEIQFSPMALAVEDFDGDGIRDIAAAAAGVPPDFGEPQPNGACYVFRGTGAGGFGTPDIYDTGGSLPVNMQAADLNGDNKKDLIFANAGDPNSNPEWFNDSIGLIMNISTSGNLAFGLTGFMTQSVHGPFAVAAADFDMNGNVDIAAVNYGAQSGLSQPPFVSVYMGTGNGTFNPGSPPTYATGGILGGQYLAVGNFDTNPAPDLIVAHAANRVGKLLNTTAAAPTVTATQVNNGAAQRSRVTSLTVTFSTQVQFAGPVANAFTLVRTGGGAVSFTATASVQNGVTVVTLNNFTGAEAQSGSLRDGRYTLTALASQISAGGQQMASNYTFGEAQGLFRFFGDINGDRNVDIADFGQFSATYGLNSGQGGFNSAFDFNNDGVIDIADFGQFSIRIFTVLP
jgi:hypothetical protein